MRLFSFFAEGNAEQGRALERRRAGWYPRGERGVDLRRKIVGIRRYGCVTIGAAGVD
jgi:hypothetical protein